ncbi:hypothetical protein K438DRAFT_1772015 [Mycena galopus ATCC 62051]|nr:hypothetical protein K438DRAFT_1772015 [Mycena galopus ATCC 62051]
MPRPFTGPRIHPEDHNNPTCSNYKSTVQLKSASLSRPGCTNKETVRRAIQNKNLFDKPSDTVEEDYSYVDPEYKEQIFKPQAPRNVRSPYSQPDKRHGKSSAAKAMKSRSTSFQSIIKSKTKSRVIGSPILIEDTPPDELRFLPRDKLRADKTKFRLPVSGAQHTSTSTNTVPRISGIQSTAIKSEENPNLSEMLNYSKPLQKDTQHSSIHQFLSNVGGFDLSNWQERFEAKETGEDAFDTFPWDV